MARVGIYLRISEDKDGDQRATSRQRADCTKFAKQRGWTVADVFEDVDLSAFKRTVKRPEFERMIGAVRDKAIDGVVAWKMDRITRRQRDLVRLDEACEVAGGFIATAVEGIDTRQPTGRFVAELLVAQARMESENSGIRQRRKAEENAKQGRPSLGGSRLFGYSSDRTKIEPKEATLIREAIQRVYAGEGIRGICNDWKARGVATTTGRPWAQTPLRRSLISPALSAQREHNGTMIAGTWPAIVTPDDTRRLRAILTDPARNKLIAGARRYLLTGILRCGLCGLSLTARPRIDHVRRYVCARQPGNANCGKIARLGEPIEALVTAAVCVALDGADVRQHIDKPTNQTADLLTAIRSDEDALAELSRDYYADKRISRPEYFAARDTLSARLEAARQDLGRANGTGILQKYAGAGDEVRRQWPEIGLDQQRAIIASIVDHVVLDPAPKGRNVFDPSLVRIVWRY